MSNKKIVVIGGGLAGLSVAWHLQEKGILCQLYEKEADVGGLCRTKKVGSFLFDYDGHLLHFRHPEMLSLVKDFLGDNLIEHKRHAWVYSFGRYTPYPFQANLYGLPMRVVKECLAGFIKARHGKGEKTSENFLQWIKNTFGLGIARHFMVPYNLKFWTVPLQQMTCDWLDGFIPQPTLEQVIGGTVEESRRQLGYNAHFWYPREGGIGRLPQAFREKLKHVFVGHELARINSKAREIVFTNGVKRNFDHLVLTIPLPELPKLMPDMPNHMKALFQKLRWNSVYNLNLGVSQRQPCDKHWIYFPHKNVNFFRLGFYHNFARDLNPPGTGSIYAEISYGASRKIDLTKINAMIERDLYKLGLLGGEDEVLVRDVNDIKYAYPIYDRNYHQVRQKIIEYLAEQQISLCGRYGSWRYMSMEDVLLDGKSFAQRWLG